MSVSEFVRGMAVFEGKQTKGKVNMVFRMVDEDYSGTSMPSIQLGWGEVHIVKSRRYDLNVIEFRFYRKVSSKPKIPQASAVPTALPPAARVHRPHRYG